MSLVNSLEWRYATKAFNGQKVPKEKLDAILNAARLAPTSSGLEPFEIFVISSQELKEKIKPIAFGQNQITECSDILVFAAWDNYTVERINAAFDQTNEQRGFKNEGWENYRQFLLGSYPQRDAKVNAEHTARQAYIAFAMALAEAAHQKVDATPMEGFDPAALDQLLGLGSKGLKSVVIMPIGYRKEDSDWLVKLKKVRRPIEKLVTYLK